MDLAGARERLWAHGKLLRGIEEAAGIEVPDAILRHLPLGGDRGSKVLILMRETKRNSPIVIPDSVHRDPERDGWVLAASADAGAILGDGERAEDLLGLHVTVPHNGGTVLKVKDEDDDYRGRFILWCERDILTVIGKVVPK